MSCRQSRLSQKIKRQLQTIKGVITDYTYMSNAIKKAACEGGFLINCLEVTLSSDFRQHRRQHVAFSACWG